MLTLLVQETFAMCYNDQVLGEWQIGLTEYNHTPDGDKIACSWKSDEPIVRTKHITLLSPNRAIDKDGYTGTWTMNYAQELEIKVGGFTYFWYVSFIPLDTERSYSMCNKSRVANAWSYEDGVTRGKFACVTAVNIKPKLDEVCNTHLNGVPPVVHFYDYQGEEVHEERIPVSQQATSADAGLPKTFDWRNVSGVNYISAAEDIERCSAWGAVAFTQMMESRIRIATNGSLWPHFSVEHLVDCNVFQQGCISTHPEDHAKFAYQFGLLDRSQYGKPFPPPDFDTTCLTTQYLSGDRYFVDSYQYMGGYYGAKVSVREMKEEIYRNGPIVANLQENGIFGDDPYGPKREYFVYPWDNPQRHFYFDVVKAQALVIGWTTLPSGAEAWIVQNAFGPEWNGDGTALVALGVNAYAIESAPFVAYWRPDGAVKYGAESAATLNLIVGFLAVVIALIMVLFVLLRWRPADTYQQLQSE